MESVAQLAWIPSELHSPRAKGQTICPIQSAAFHHPINTQIAYVGNSRFIAPEDPTCPDSRHNIDCSYKLPCGEEVSLASASWEEHDGGQTLVIGRVWAVGTGYRDVNSGAGQLFERIIVGGECDEPLRINSWNDYVGVLYPSRCAIWHVDQYSNRLVTVITLPKTCTCARDLAFDDRCLRIWDERFGVYEFNALEGEAPTPPPPLPWTQQRVTGLPWHCLDQKYKVLLHKSGFVWVEDSPLTNRLGAAAPTAFQYSPFTKTLTKLPLTQPDYALPGRGRGYNPGTGLTCRTLLGRGNDILFYMAWADNDLTRPDRDSKIERLNLSTGTVETTLERPPAPKKEWRSKPPTDWSLIDSLTKFDRRISRYSIVGRYDIGSVLEADLAFRAPRLREGGHQLIFYPTDGASHPYALWETPVYPLEDGEKHKPYVTATENWLAWHNPAGFTVFCYYNGKTVTHHFTHYHPRDATRVVGFWMLQNPEDGAVHYLLGRKDNLLEHWTHDKPGE